MLIVSKILYFTLLYEILQNKSVKCLKKKKLKKVQATCEDSKTIKRDVMQDDLNLERFNLIKDSKKIFEF